MKIIPALISVICLFVPPELAAASTSGPTIIGIGPTSSVGVYAYDVSNDGRVVLGDAMTDSGIVQPFLWNTGQTIFLTDPGVQGYAGGLSADGTIASLTLYDEAGLPTPFRWENGLVALPLLSGSQAWAGKISKDGSTIIGLDYRMTGLRWTSSGAENLEGLTFTRGVSNDGSVIVGETYVPGAGVFEAARWTAEGGAVRLGSFGGNSSASAVSGDGSVIVGTSGSASEQAFRWTESTGMVPLPLLSGSYNNFPKGVSFDGNVVVMTSSLVGAPQSEAVIWTVAGGTETLRNYLLSRGASLADLNGWTLTDAGGISPDARFIVGRGINSAGLFQSFLVDLRPVQSPVITSSLSATATYNSLFSYTITATNGPTSFDAFVLPGGLSIDNDSGVISGTPTSAGSFPVTIVASNEGGDGTATLNLLVGKAGGSVSISNTLQTYTGMPRPVTVTTSPSGLETTVTYNGSETPPIAVGSYDVIATIISSNYEGSTSATLSIVTPALQILTQPVSLTVVEGSPAIFTVEASGPGLITYQWRKGNSPNGPIIGTHSTLTIPSASLTDAGSYRVTVSNGAATLMSNAAKLTVNQASVIVAPLITEHPKSQTVTLPNSKKPVSVKFSVIATGTAPLNYQWQKNEVDLPAQNGSTLTVSKVSLLDNGAQYRVRVWNSAGSVLSNTATLVVN